jgi:hypothetical protein
MVCHNLPQRFEINIFFKAKLVIIMLQDGFIQLEIQCMIQRKNFDYFFFFETLKIF